MDISFKTQAGRFNCRVCGVIVRNNQLLVMRDELAPYYYLPGGRVKLHETAEAAILRELSEELHIEARILRPLWLCQSFFTEEAGAERFHELCIYFLADGSGINDAQKFSIPDNGHDHSFEWIAFEELKHLHLYPEFIREGIYHLPESLEMIVEKE